MRHLLSLTLLHDQDVVTARQRAAQVAAQLGYDVSEQTRIATAVSEIVRNAFRYTGGGAVNYEVDVQSRPQRLIVHVTDKGPGIPHLEEVLNGQYQSRTGMGMGIVGARRLMDRFSIESSAGGTHVVLEKFLPARAGLQTADRVRAIAEQVHRRRPQGLIEEVQQQNQELMRALDELQRKQQELVRLNHELEDTNRGVVALYAELDEKADHLRRADELKSRFLSNMTHEFRTPVNSIIGLCNLLMDDRQREGREPEPEIMYIRKAADQLSELVNDLLDLAKVEAGKSVVRPATFEIANLFGALRGMLRPLLVNQSVALVFESPDGLPPLRTDEAKVSQILRNLISNALKFTEAGEVRVSAIYDEEQDRVSFTVSDTGIGIAPDDQHRIFEEFTQLEHRLQRGVRGTGLGLPLSRRLAELLGGTLTVRSEPGVGSAFSVSLPVEYVAPGIPDEPFEWVPDPARLPLLVIEDASDAQYFYQKVLRTSPFQLYPARSPAEAERALDVISPAAIVLDLVLAGEQVWELLARLRADERTRRVPIVIVSTLPEQKKGLALGADAFLVKPLDRRALLDTLMQLQAKMRPAVRVLTVDDEEVARFLIRQCLPGPAFEVIEASSGEEGLRRARDEHPDAILLDLAMPDVGGREVLRRLRAQDDTKRIPVVIVTAAALDDRERAALLSQAASIVSKAEVSRETIAGAVRGALRHG